MNRAGGFNGVHVVSLESRHPQQMAKLIERHGGVPLVAPSMREAPLERNEAALSFAADLLAGRFDIVIFLTGVGTRMLTRVIETQHSNEDFVEALKKVQVVARGPKPVAALNESGVPIDVRVPEPNTWRELLQALGPLPAGTRVAVQEYGTSNPELIQGLHDRGARVTAVPLYRWQLPEDVGPLRQAVRAIAEGPAEVVLFTTGVQVPHLLQVSTEMKLEEGVRSSLAEMMVASVGPICSESLQTHGIQVDMEPSHPKMGFLVKEAAGQSAGILASKRGRRNQTS